MSIQPFDQVLFIVFFVYGLAFFGMGLTLALEAGRSPALAEARILWPLAAFGLIHGTHEWLESYIIQAERAGTQLPGWLSWLRLGLLIASFISLMIYGIQTFHSLSSQASIWKRVSLFVLGMYVLIIVLSALFTYHTGEIFWFKVLDALARYLLAVPAAILATLALRLQAVHAGQGERHRLASYLNLAAIGFGLYSLTQIFVSPLEMFPANILNGEMFRSLLGFPIQILRTAMAVLITLSLLWAMQVVEKDRQGQFLAAQQAKLEALRRVQEELIKREALQRELLLHTVRAQEDERARLALELHDETSQILTAFSLDLATLQTIIQDKGDAKKLVKRLQSLSRQMSQGLYRLVRDLRPAQLDDLGLVSALEYLLENSSSKDLDVSMDVSGQAYRLSSVAETVLYRVAQEALNNVARHAQIKQAQISLTFTPVKVVLAISDKGVGFDHAEVFTPPRGWGLTGMRERVESVGGELQIRSAPGQGTVVEVVIPRPAENVRPNKENMDE